MARLFTGTGFLNSAFCLAFVLGAAAFAQGQDDAPKQPFSIEQIVGGDEPEAGLPVSDGQLRNILKLYEGTWRGSIDLTDKYGTVLQTLPVESEYRLENNKGKLVLLGRFQFGRDEEAKYSSSKVEISNGFLINHINQQGKNTVYRGEIEDGKIAWREYGVPRSEYNVFYESFEEHNDRRVITTQSRNLMRGKDGQEKTYFTAGRYLYAGPLGDWTLPEGSFKEPPASGDGVSDTGESVSAPEKKTASFSTQGEMARRRSGQTSTEGVPGDLKVSQAEVASLEEQLAAEQAVSAKLRARIETLVAKIAELTGKTPEQVAAEESDPDEDTTAAASGAAETDASSSGSRSSFRSRAR